jgi:archaellum component FlaG (FlaF/FlaG flagellin family)
MKVIVILFVCLALLPWTSNAAFGFPAGFSSADWLESQARQQNMVIESTISTNLDDQSQPKFYTGTDLPLKITIKNIGSMSWSSKPTSLDGHQAGDGRLYQIRGKIVRTDGSDSLTYDETDYFVNDVNLNVGDTGIYYYKLKLPEEPGNYKLLLSLYEDRALKNFYGTVYSKEFEVEKKIPEYDGDIVSCRVDGKDCENSVIDLNLGKTYQYQLTIRNTGKNDWKSEGVKIHVIPDDRNLQVSDQKLGNTVFAGQEETVTIPIILKNGNSGETHSLDFELLQRQNIFLNVITNENELSKIWTEYKAVTAKADTGSSQSSDISSNTPSSTQFTVNSGSVSNIKDTSVILTGMVADSAGKKYNEWFEYGPIATAEYKYQSLSTYGDAGSYTIPIIDLKPQTVYHYRAVASNSKGTKKYGEEKTFTTLPSPQLDRGTNPNQLTVTTLPASDTQDTSTLLVGSVVDPTNSGNTGRFEYGTTINYGKTSGSTYGGAGEYGIRIFNLNPLTTYHYRAVASNSAGTYYGTDRTFTTTASPATQSQQVQQAQISTAQVSSPSLVQLPSQTGSLYLFINPTGTQVYIDGSYKGTISVSQLNDIKAGEHTLKFSKSGYNDKTMTVSISPGQTTNLNVELQKTQSSQTDQKAPVQSSSTGSLYLAINPTGTQVYIDGSYKGTISVSQLNDIKAGEHTLKFSKSGYNDKTMTVSISPGQTTNLNVELQKTQSSQTDQKAPVQSSSTGSLYLAINPTGTQVYIDGSYKGTISVSQLNDIKAGEHTLKFSKSGYNDKTMTVSISPGQTTNLNVELQKTQSSQTDQKAPVQSSSTGSLYLAINPTGTQVYIDGSYKGTISVSQLNDIKAGEHTLKFSKSGYNDKTMTVSISPGQTTNLNVELQKTQVITTTRTPTPTKTTKITTTRTPTPTKTTKITTTRTPTPTKTTKITTTRTPTPTKTTKK